MLASSDPVAVFAAVFATLYVAHSVADHWVQTDRQATCKSMPGWPGRRACAAHVGTYTATAVALLLVLALVVGVPLQAGPVAAGLTISAVSHYVADRRTPLRWLAVDVLRMGRFWSLGAPRAGRDDNPSLGTGAYALDQSYHVFFAFIAAVVIA